MLSKKAAESLVDIFTGDSYKIKIKAAGTNIVWGEYGRRKIYLN